MKRIFAQKGLCYYFNFLSLFVVIFSICGGLLIDITIFYMLFISLFLTPISLLSLINRIYYTDTVIDFNFVARKHTVKYENIKEIFVRKHLFFSEIIFNFDRELGYHCRNYYEYDRGCAIAGIKDSLCLIGIARRDLNKLLQNYKGKIN